jgi:hypothetical protein
MTHLFNDTVLLQTPAGLIPGTIQGRRGEQVLVSILAENMPEGAQGFTQSGKNWTIWVDENSVSTGSGRN